jgi:activator of HSP90 ATPase
MRTGRFSRSDKDLKLRTMSTERYARSEMDLNVKYRIDAPLEKVWKSFVDMIYIKKWCPSYCTMNDRIGTQFKIMGEEIHGKNLEVVPNKKLVQEWYLKGWKHPSFVTIKLSKEGDSTIISLTHTNIPHNDYFYVEESWTDKYIGLIRKALVL